LNGNGVQSGFTFLKHRFKLKRRWKFLKTLWLFRTMARIEVKNSLVVPAMPRLLIWGLGF
jgi:hypothetical protein